MYVYKYVDQKDSVAMLVTITRFTQVVNLRYQYHIEHAKKGSTIALKPIADVTKSPKQCISCPQKNGKVNVLLTTRSQGRNIKQFHF